MVKAVRVLLIIAILLVSVTSVAALPQWMVSLFGMCDDGDKGPTDLDKPLPFIGIGAAAADPSGKSFDECVNEKGEKVPVGRFVRERYCDKDKKVAFKDYDCAKYDFAACVDVPGRGASCVKNIPTTKCGDGVVQPPEKCDPPGAACKDAAGKPGVCNAGCNCVVAPPKKCGNMKLDPGEQCDPPGAACKDAAGNPGACNPGCQCVVPPKNKCGDKKIQAPEKCDPPGAPCKNAQGGVAVCDANCGCPDEKKPACGDKKLDAGEQCDPPGAECLNAAGSKAICSKTCGCPVTRIPTWCTNGRLDDWEDCEPPGSRCVKGGKPGLCNEYCKCAGQNGLLLPGEREIQIGQTPPAQPPTATPPPAQPKKSCDELCSERGMSTQQADHSSFIMSQLQQYSCVSGARIAAKGTLTLKGENIQCTCYSKEPPSVSVDSNVPVCNTPCGPVSCGSSASCPCPGKENCVLTASCAWKGWSWQQGRAIPLIGATAQ